MGQKLLKALAATDLSLRTLLTLAERIERRQVQSTGLRPVYRAAIAGSMYAGYRDGIAAYRAVAETDPRTPSLVNGPRVEMLDVCPICGRRSYVPHLVSPDQLHGVSGSYRYVRCSDCRSVFQNPRVVQQDLALCYPENYFTHRDQPLSAAAPAGSLVDRLRWQILSLADGRPPSGPKNYLIAVAAHFMKRIPSLRRRARFGLLDPLGLDEAGRRCLEVGPGRGHDMVQLARLGWEVEGLDFDTKAARTAQDQSGCCVIEGTLEDSPWAAGTFDLIYASHVVEHFPEPRRDLRKAFELLRPGGRLVLVYPNPDSLVARIYGRWAATWDPPRHLVLPSASGISALLYGIGFDRVSTEPLHRHGAGWAALAQHYRVGGSRIEDWPLRLSFLARVIGLVELSAPSSLLLGEELLVVARRTD